jgi:outer membrane protein
MANGTFGAMLGVCAALTLAPDARAEDASFVPRAGSWFTQNGPIYINFKKESEVSVGGSVAPGAEATPRNGVTVSNSIGYNFTSNISGQLVLGFMPRTAVNNQDGVYLGKVTYGAPSVLLDYRLASFGAFQPFIGIGGMYLFFTDEADGALTNLKVKDSVGLILRAGAEVMLNDKYGLYLAANRIFIDADARGYLGTARVDADLDLDPWIFQTGLTYRF